MTLPAGQLARGTFDFRGTAVAIRSLTRKETFHIKEIGGDLDAAEVFMLACGTDSTLEEVDAFRSSEGDAGLLNDLVQAIADLSGIPNKEGSNGSDPKVLAHKRLMSEASSTKS